MYGLFAVYQHRIKAGDIVIPTPHGDFAASQVCYHDIIVDSYNNFHRDTGIGESEKPYGPFRCTECGKKYEELDELDKNKGGEANSAAGDGRV